MARGWESKGVESQQADAGRRPSGGPAVSADEQLRRDQAEALRLALARVRDQLAGAARPDHRAMLEQAAAALEARIASLT
jgi:hypothetical protein